MIKDITIGQYFPGESFIHRLDPRVKLVLTFVNILAIFMCRNFFSLALMSCYALFSILLSRVSLKVILKGLRMIFMIIIFTSILQIIYNKNGEVLFEWCFILITAEGVATAVFIIVRVISLILTSSLLTYTTSPTLLTDGIESLLSPAKKIGLPAHELAMMMTIALRFIPTLIEEIDKIMSAQKARGADFESGGLIRRVKAFLPILIPLFVSAFRRAYELAMAMECRCYQGGEGRTKMKILRMGRLDYLALLCFCVYLAGTVLLN